MVLSDKRLELWVTTALWQTERERARESVDLLLLSLTIFVCSLLLPAWTSHCTVSDSALRNPRWTVRRGRAICSYSTVLQSLCFLRFLRFPGNVRIHVGTGVFRITWKKKRTPPPLTLKRKQLTPCPLGWYWTMTHKLKQGKCVVFMLLTMPLCSSSPRQRHCGVNLLAPGWPLLF